MQGYYFSKPIPGGEFAQLLRGKKALVRENASE
jgi:EAL domain-containing protein (putative c-di-GMP-specific phosphodiesterase class I)